VTFEPEDESHILSFRDFLKKVEGSPKGVLPIDTTEDRPDGYVVPDSWFFEVCYCGPDRFTFESKWAPPIKTMVKIAKIFRFSFMLKYDEGSTLYGTYLYDFRDDELWHKDLENDVLEKYFDKPEYEENLYDILDEKLDEMNFELMEI
jgi:hypothetical protein